MHLVLNGSVAPLPFPATRNRPGTWGPSPLLCNPGSQGFQLLRARLPSHSPEPALRNGEWRHTHLQLGNLIQVEGVGEAALDAFVWLQLDTSRLLLCWQEIYPSSLPRTSAKGELGGFGSFKGLDGRGAVGLGHGFVALRASASENIAPLNISDQRPPNVLLPELQKIHSLLIGLGRLGKVPGSPKGWGRNQGKKRRIQTLGCPLNKREWGLLAVVSVRKVSRQTGC